MEVVRGWRGFLFWFSSSAEAITWKAQTYWAWAIRNFWSLLSLSMLKETRRVQTRLACSFGLFHCFNWLDGWGDGVFLVGIVGMTLCKNREAKNSWGISEGSVGWDCRNSKMKWQKGSWYSKMKLGWNRGTVGRLRE